MEKQHVIWSSARRQKYVRKKIEKLFQEVKPWMVLVGTPSQRIDTVNKWARIIFIWILH